MKTNRFGGIKVGIEVGIKVGMAGLAVVLGGAGCLGAEDDGAGTAVDEPPVEEVKLVHHIDAGNGHTVEFFDLGEGQVGVKEQYAIGDKPLVNVSSRDSVTLADLYRRVRTTGPVPAEIIAADAHAADTLAKPQVIHKALPKVAARSEDETLKSPVPANCSADLFGDQWSAKWFVDNFTKITSYDCGGEFTNITHYENRYWTKFWAGGKYTWLYRQFEGDFNVEGSTYIYRNGFGLPANIPLWSGSVPPRTVLAWTISGGWNSQTNHADGKSPCGHEGAVQVWCGLP